MRFAVMDDQQVYPDYPVFKGLQRPLEVFGFQGRYIGWAVGTVGGAILVFFICYVIFGVGIAFLLLLVILGAGSLFIFVKQGKGLHSKKRDRGIFIVKHTCFSELKS